MNDKHLGTHNDLGNKNPLGKQADHEKKNITTRGRRNNARVYYVLKVP